mgnify:CR=1 FL=1
MNLHEWSRRWWHVLPPQAQQEFDQLSQPHNYVRADASTRSESAIQADIRLAASKEFRSPLWRNNNGAAQMINPKRPDDPPRHVRFGLGNDSERVSKAWKSSDLIGIKPTLITGDHIGRVLGVFAAVEVKAPGWHLTDGDKRAQAQAAFMNSVTAFGGIAGFAQSVDDMRRILNDV